MRKNSPNRKFRLAVLAGGPSLERGISLNSARSVCDHLDSENLEIIPIYFDYQKKPYLISRSQLYSNTPSDFDFKLHSVTKPLSKTGLKNFLKTVDLVFPVIHGKFGEDGTVQKMLEKWKIPFIGSSSKACKMCFDKYNSNEILEKLGFYTVPILLLQNHLKNYKKQIEQFFKKNKISRAVVKPARGGSSIGVHSVNSVKEALQAVHLIFSKRMDTRAVLQPFVKGAEFTVIILENRFNEPVAFLPSEIEVDYRQNQIFDYRKKYLPSRHVTYHCPPRFSEDYIEKVQIQAQQLFKIFAMNDFARFDGWILQNGEIWFSDFNPVSGMEQNSFLFQQATLLGMSHRDLLRMLARHSCIRQKIQPPPIQKHKTSKNKKKINVIFGGDTAERQVSVMSGTNAWLKLRRENKYKTKPFLLDTKGTVWQLPYYLTLNHTVEEIVDACKRSIKNRMLLQRLRERVLVKLAADKEEITEELFLPKTLTLKEFIKQSDFVFIGLHGGFGENGTIQSMLEKEKKYFNGSGSKASRICMDKYKTGELLSKYENEGILIAPKTLVDINTFKKFTDANYIKFWRALKRRLMAKNIIVKPQADGCSAGVVRLFSSKDLKNYLYAVYKHLKHIPAHTFPKQTNIIDMPTEKLRTLLFEKFIETDKARIIKNKLIWQKANGWIEVTIGVLGEKNRIEAMNPSLTVSYGEVLTLEEKFQGGTGINITPPPEKYVKKDIVEKVKRRAQIVAKILGLEGYGRIDAFLNIYTGELMIIEANTLPALTPSTVIFQQTLAQTPKMHPAQFLKRIVELGYKRYKV